MSLAGFNETIGIPVESVSAKHVFVCLPMLRTLIDGIPIDVAKIRARLFAEIEVVADLKLVDLRDDKAEKMGVPTDVAKATQHALQSRVWSALAFVQYVGLNIDAAIIAAGCSCDPAHMHFKKAFVGGIVICWR